jgi:hypothetical protein
MSAAVALMPSDESTAGASCAEAHLIQQSASSAPTSSRLTVTGMAADAIDRSLKTGLRKRRRDVMVCVL